MRVDAFDPHEAAAFDAVVIVRSGSILFDDGDDEGQIVVAESLHGDQKAQLRMQIARAVALTVKSTAGGKVGIFDAFGCLIETVDRVAGYAAEPVNCTVVVNDPVGL